MLKRKRHNKDDSDDTEDDELITVNHNKITFYCDINYKSCFELIKAIDNVKSKIRSERVSEYEEEKSIYLHICSNGGYIYPTLAVIDHIRNSSVKIITINEGCVASAGVLITLAGHERYITKNSYMLIHEIRSECWGKYSECVDDMKNNDSLMKHLTSYIKERANNKLSEKELNEFLKHDIIWNAKKCLKYGLVDKIV
jgi:ATP-dependent protease ClpP protease subunit